MKYILPLLFLVSFSCNSNKVVFDKIKSTETEVISAIDQINQDCYKDRKTIKTIENVVGKLMKIGDVMLISVGDSKRYQPCELPIKFDREGQEIVFSAIVKEIFQAERRMGTPVILTSISTPK